MVQYLRRAAFVVGTVWLFGQIPAVHAQTYSTNYSIGWNNGDSVLGVGDWTGSVATATISNGVFTTSSGFTYTNYVVYQGDISNSFLTPIGPDTTNIASVQLLAQVVAGDSMPDSSICPDRQGGICFSNSIVPGDADVYAWSTNGWLLVTNASLTVATNSWVLLTLVANYTGGDPSFTPTNVVFYEVFLNGTNLLPSSGHRYSHSSSFSNDVNGTYICSSAHYVLGAPTIKGLYLSGSGAVDTLLVKSGLPSKLTYDSPLSSGIGIRAYQGAGGIYVEFETQNENGSRQVVLQVRQLNSTNIIYQVSTNAAGQGNGFYRFLVPGLSLGGSYDFVVVDESGKSWSVPNVKVTSFATELLQMSQSGLTMSFNTSPGLQYTIQWATQLAGPWSNAVAPFTAVIDHATVYVPFPDPNAKASFFRILQR